ncbi:exonuclease domain-containing protein [Curtobacterium sp. RRHDQ66]|uniref:exonuclease domain-containing protein n=1 Tax=Curtobacterium guangdongense TaxID=3413380 RepID=UPI003BEF8EA6
MHNGYAVIDFETTGLSPTYGHRIIEIGLVHVAPSGAIERSFETLVNPGRDLGPVHIHQIRGRDVADAPTFAEIAGSLVELLEGRVLVAHNARFEAAFLAAELARVGVTSPISADEALCTMRLAATFLPGSGRKLADCCSAYDIELANAHEALADATATALLLEAYLGASENGASFWNAWGELAHALRWPPDGAGSAKWTPRRRTSERAPVTMLDRATDHLPQLSGSVHTQQYVALLNAALADRLFSVHETDELTELARDLGLTHAQRVTLHEQYFADLAAAALDDTVLTTEERNEIDTVATLLDIGPSTLEAALNDPRPMATTGQPRDDHDHGIKLDGSSVVVLTGEMQRPQEAIEADLQRLGISNARAVTKKTTLVFAADVGSVSGKAREAKQYGIPIASEEELEGNLAEALQTVR